MSTLPKNTILLFVKRNRDSQVEKVGYLVSVSERIQTQREREREMGNISCVFCGCVEQASVGVVERWGRFERLAEPGLHFFNPLAGQCFAGYLSTRISSLDVKIETKTKVSLKFRFLFFFFWNFLDCESLFILRFTLKMASFLVVEKIWRIRILF